MSGRRRARGGDEAAGLDGTTDGTSEVPAVIGSRPYGGVQKTRQGGRKLFAGKRVEAFLDHLAATCNVTAAARAAGVTTMCVYAKRARDPDLRAAWEEAIQIGYARIEAELLRLANEGGPRPRLPDDGDEAADGEAPAGGIDKDLALQLLRDHRRGADGRGVRQGRGGRPPEAAAWAEVEIHFIRRLRLLQGRMVRADAPEDGAEKEA